MNPLQLRIGQGYDSHALTENRKLILGGVTIPHYKGLFGHSDADALLHAITDALIGAAALGDIGQLFPDNDAQFKNADSRIFLRKVKETLTTLNYTIINMDATIIAQQPKMAPHIMLMRQHIAEDLQIDIGQVNIKAKTNEKLGFLGREEGIATQAVVLLYKNEV